MDEDMSEWTVPKVASLDDFELAKAIKEKGRPTEKYETLDGSTQLKGTLVNWEPVFVQFKDTDSGKLLPVKVLSPPVYPEEEEAPSNDKGKRKAVE
ncbi:uncharacterized protein BXZ73DRAFT_97219 [Epithele typhae]|uniref:uncharacterized protein n=1 Tax=Epithele typhae TaxID=378194 RepID=UPI0020086A5F|nr:uncharacterized protein BXZ73DRAFT_97219 [Epithele typhae]KAH9943164.1 hypothetical protein BXZ73DRAFT_97219 [Epithele typhae]